MADLSALGLLKSDEKLKGVDHKWLKAHNDEIESVKKALEAKKYKVDVVDDEKDALEQIKNAIPHGSSIYTAGSTTLAEVGLVDYLKGENPYNNIKAKILAEKDQKKTAELYGEGFNADFWISSVCAVSEEGEFLVVDATNTRVGGFTTAKKVLIIIGSNKIVKDRKGLHQRAEEFCLPLESGRARVAYKVPGSSINNSLLIAGPNPFGAPGRFHFVIVKKSFVLIIFAFVVVAFCQTPARPQIPTQYTSSVGAEVRNKNESAVGGGYVAYDFPANRAAQNLGFDHKKFDIHVVDRYDIHEIYIVNLDDKKCFKNNVNGTMPNFWSWVEKASYVGKREFFRRQLDFWELSESNVNSTLGVDPAKPNVPVVVVFTSPDHRLAIEYFRFTPQKPENRDFVVPEICM